MKTVEPFGMKYSPNYRKGGKSIYCIMLRVAQPIQTRPSQLREVGPRDQRGKIYVPVLPAL